MIHENSSNIIEQCQQITLDNGELAEALIFHNGLTLVLSKQTMAMFKSFEAITDPLGNGLISSIELDESSQFQVVNQKIVERYQSGFIGLMDGRAMLVTPNVIQLFETPADALRNMNEIARLALG